MTETYVHSDKSSDMKKYSKQVAKKDDSEEFDLAESRRELGECRRKTIAKAFAKQATTYAVARLLHKTFEDSPRLKMLVKGFAVCKWIYDVYHIGVANIPSSHSHLKMVVKAADELGITGKIDAHKMRVSRIGMIGLRAAAEKTIELEGSRMASIFSGYDGTKAAAIYDDEREGATGVVVVCPSDASKGLVYWNNAILSIPLRACGPGLYNVAREDGDVCFIPEEWRVEKRAHRSKIEEDIEKQVANAHSSGIRRGIIVTGPQGTGKTSSIMNALCRIENTYVIKVGDLSVIDDIFLIFAGVSDKPVIIVIDDVDRLVDSHNYGLLMRALDGSTSPAPVITIMTANDPTGSLPNAIWNRRRRIDSIIVSQNPSTVGEISDILDNACKTYGYALVKADDDFAKYVVEKGFNHSDIASAIETAKHIDKLETIDLPRIKEYMDEQMQAAESAKEVSRGFRKSESESGFRRD
jgi:hypothetical protein